MAGALKVYFSDFIKMLDLRNWTDFTLSEWVSSFLMAHHTVISSITSIKFNNTSIIVVITLFIALVSLLYF